MRASEIIRVIALSVLGTFLMFLVQPFIYKQGWIFVPNTQNSSADLESWVNGAYTTAAGVVFGASVFCTVLWCVITAGAKAHRMEELKNWSLCWWVLGLFPLLSIGLAIGVFNPIEQPRLSLAIFFVLDILILFWITTGSSTPGLLMYTPPLAQQLRSLLDRF